MNKIILTGFQGDQVRTNSELLGLYNTSKQELINSEKDYSFIKFVFRNQRNNFSLSSNEFVS